MMTHLQLESGVVEPKLAPFVIGPLIAEVADMNEPAAGLAQVTLHAMPCQLKIFADPALVERALGNLIGNAIRHAKATRILIGARWHERQVCIWVIDDGAGIPADDIPHLFKDFVQGSDHGQEIRGGFGLGLSTTRRLARLMGGDAGLETKWVKGCAFWLELPAG
jgi:signal transduction histidine kinase